MTDKELLLAMSDMLDEKLKPIDERLATVDDRLATVDDRLATVDDRLATVDERLATVDDRLATLENNFASMNDRLKKIEITQENDILPRLQNIEDCYVSTYKRYQSGIEQIETMQADIEVIKRVVSEHSEKLQKIS